jgi:AcrR family transcriptional regulator
MALFVERGFEAVTVDEICRAADVAKGTFFLHFPSKDALLTEYGRNAIGELAVMFADDRGSACDAIRRALRFLAERVKRNRDVVMLLAHELPARPPMFARHHEQIGDLARLVASVIKRGQETGEFRRGVDPLLAGIGICAPFFAIVIEWARRGTKLDMEDAIDQELDLVLNGLNKRNSSTR